MYFIPSTNVKSLCVLVTVLGGTVSKSDNTSPLGIYLSTGRLYANEMSSHGDSEEMTLSCQERSDRVTSGRSILQVEEEQG